MIPPLPAARFAAHSGGSERGMYAQRVTLCQL